MPPGAHSLVFTELSIVFSAGPRSLRSCFRLLRLPLVLGYIVAGLWPRPARHRPRWSDASLSPRCRTSADLLFFTIGLEFSIRTIARVGLPTLLTVIYGARPL